MSRTRRLSGVLFFFTLYPELLSATILNPAVLDDLEQQQRDRLKQSLRQREELERTQPFPPLSPNTKTVIPGACFILHTITFDGAEHLSDYRRHQLTSGFTGQCLNLSQINQLIKNVSNWYIQQGYITSRAFLTEQDLSQGQLNITVLEGKLETITLDGESPLSLTMAFSHLKGKILNLRDIEQGMEQINRVRLVPVKIEILPGNQVGYSVINLTAKPEFPIRFNASFSNRGQKNTGSEQLNATLTANNLFGLAERWSVGGTCSSAFSHAHHAQTLQTGVSIPYGYGLFDYNYSDSNYVNIINSKGKGWRSSGNAQTHRVTGNWTLYRDSDMKTSIMFGLTHRNNHNALMDKRLNGSSYVLTSATIGINHGQRLGGGFATFNPSFNRGIPYLGSESDAGKLSSFPKAEFTKWTLATSYYLPVTTNLVYLTSLYGQWASDRLYSSERLTIGGESSVRGFKEQHIDGNNGCYWRNELNWTLFSWPTGPVGVIAALDTGYLQHDPHDAHDSGKLWGGAVGLFSTGQNLSSQLIVGLPLSYPGWLTPDRVSVYYRIGLEF